MKIITVTLRWFFPFKELLQSFVEGVRQALQLMSDLPKTTVTLLDHCVWSICHQLQQFPDLLDHVIRHMATVTDITLCVFIISGEDAHAVAVALETNIPVKF